MKACDKWTISRFFRFLLSTQSSVSSTAEPFSGYELRKNDNARGELPTWEVFRLAVQTKAMCRVIFPTATWLQNLTPHSPPPPLPPPTRNLRSALQPPSLKHFPPRRPSPPPPPHLHLAAAARSLPRAPSPAARFKSAADAACSRRRPQHAVQKRGAQVQVEGAAGPQLVHGIRACWN